MRYSASTASESCLELGAAYLSRLYARERTRDARSRIQAQGSILTLCQPSVTKRLTQIKAKRFARDRRLVPAPSFSACAIAPGTQQCHRQGREQEHALQLQSPTAVFG